MLALIGAEVEQVRAAVEAGDAVDIANYNAPGQIVIAGARDAVTAAAARSGARQAVPLPVSAPFHCRLMRPAEERLAPDLAAVHFADPTVPLYNNVDATRVTSADAARDGLMRQVSRPVRWTEIIERIVADEGVRTFVEVGPGSVLSGLIRRIDRNVERFAVNDCASLAAARAALSRA
jgi:[acyl-carrier-protein] S-malonyltransferase